MAYLLFTIHFNSTPYTFTIILLKSIILVLEKNLTAKILIFIILLFIKRSLINLLRSSKWGSTFTILIFLLYFN